MTIPKTHRVLPYPLLTAVAILAAAGLLFALAAASSHADDAGPNPCVETGTYTYVDACVTPGTITATLNGDTEFAICVGGSITPPTINATVTSGTVHREITTCTLICSPCPTSGNYAVPYTPVTYWVPVIPDVFNTPGTYTYTAKVKGVPATGPCGEVGPEDAGTITVHVMNTNVEASGTGSSNGFPVNDDDTLAGFGNEIHDFDDPVGMKFAGCTTADPTHVYGLSLGANGPAAATVKLQWTNAGKLHVCSCDGATVSEIASGKTWLLGSLPTGLFFDGTMHSDTIGDIKFTSTVSYLGKDCTADDGITLFQCDLDIDSDNNNGLGQPARSKDEDRIELGQTRPGKYVGVNKHDSSPRLDNVPNFADGFDKFSNSGTDQGGSFVPVVLEIPTPVEIGSATVSFSYDGSDPASVTRTPAGGFHVYRPAPGGNLRLWTKSGSANRNSASIAAGGDYVPPGVALSGTQLGGNRVTTLYLEAVSKTTAPQTIAVTVQPSNGPLVTDVIKLRTAEINLNGDSDGIGGVDYGDTADDEAEMVLPVLVPLNLKDKDKDGLADCEDQVISSAEPDSDFALLKLELSPLKADGSDFSLPDGTVYLSGGESVRIFRKSSPHTLVKPCPTIDAGSSAVDLFPELKANNGRIELLVEGVAASECSLTVTYQSSAVTLTDKILLQPVGVILTSDKSAVCLSSRNPAERYANLEAFTVPAGLSVSISLDPQPGDAVAHLSDNTGVTARLHPNEDSAGVIHVSARLPAPYDRTFHTIPIRVNPCGVCGTEGLFPCSPSVDLMSGKSSPAISMDTGNFAPTVDAGGMLLNSPDLTVLAFRPGHALRGADFTRHPLGEQATGFGAMEPIELPPPATPPPVPGPPSFSYGPSAVTSLVKSGTGVVIQTPGSSGLDAWASASSLWQFYSPSDLDGLDPDGKPKIKTGASSLIEWQVQNSFTAPNGSSAVMAPGTITLTKKLSGAVVETTAYHLTSGPNAKRTWTVTRTAGGQPGTSETLVSEWLDSGHTSRLDRIERNGVVTENLCNTVNGQLVLVSKTVDPAGLNQVTTYEYAGTPPILSAVVAPDGVRTEYTRDGSARCLTEKRFHTGDSTQYTETAYTYSGSISAPASVTKSRNGTVIARTWYTYHTPGTAGVETVEQAATATAAQGAPGNLLTTTTYDAQDRPVSIVHPDGSTDVYAYDSGTFAPADLSAPDSQADFTLGDNTSPHLRTTHTRASTLHPAGVAGKSTRAVTITNLAGGELLSEDWVCSSSGAFTRVAWTLTQRNALGQPTDVTRSNGDIHHMEWGCCGKEYEQLPDGEERSYLYDGNKRLQALVRLAYGTQPARTTTYTYDLQGNPLSETETAGSLSRTSLFAYDAIGRETSRTDTAGRTTTTGYSNTAGSLVVTTVTRPGGATEITVPDYDGRPVSVTGTAAAPRYYEYGFDSSPSAFVKVYTGTGSISTIPRWEKTTTDTLGRVIRVEKPMPAPSSSSVISYFSYNPAGQLWKSAPPDVAPTLYEYNELGAMVRSGLDLNNNGILEPVSSERIQIQDTWFEEDGTGTWWRTSVSRTYPETSVGTPVTLSTTRERLTGFAANVRVETRVTDIHGNETVRTTEVLRNLHTVTKVTTSPFGTIPAVEVYTAGVLVSSRSFSDITTTYQNDGFGRPTHVTDPRTGTSITHYNAAGRIDSVTDAAGNTTAFAYDPVTGLRTAVTDPLGHTTFTSYTARGEVLHTWGSATNPQEYEYNDFGQPVRLSTYRGGTGWDGGSWPTATTGTADNTTWTYDVRTGLLLQKTHADGNGPIYTYTPAGRLATRTWARPVPGSSPAVPLVTSYSYDSGTGDLAVITYSDSTPSVSFTYKRDGRTYAVGDGAGGRVFNYSPTTLDLTSESLPGYGSHTLTRQYDTLGRNSGFSVVAAGSPPVTEYWVAYGYDSATGRLNAISSSLATVAYGYLPNSDRLETTAMGGLVTTRTYEDHRDLVVSLENKVGTDVVSKYEYTYDAAGRRLTAARSGSAFMAPDTLSYDYNTRSEVTSAASSEAATNDYSYLFDYDPMGNRLLTTRGLAAPATTAYATSNVNAYTDVTTSAGTVYPVYDEDGNAEFLPAAAGSGAADWSFAWDAENRLTWALSEDILIEYVYDYLSRRAVKKIYVESGTAVWTLASETRFLYDGRNLIAEVDAASSASPTWYVWGLDLSQSIHGAGGIGGLLGSNLSFYTSPVHYTFDANGNVSELIGSIITVQAHYEYDPYGNTTVATGILPTVWANPFRFSTKYLDSDTGLYYYGYRWYSPDLGRWLSRDPLNEEGGINLLGFCGNDGVNGFDPDGRDSWWAETAVWAADRIEAYGGSYSGSHAGTVSYATGGVAEAMRQVANLNPEYVAKERFARYWDTASNSGFAAANAQVLDENLNMVTGMAKDVLLINAYINFKNAFANPCDAYDVPTRIAMGLKGASDVALTVTMVRLAIVTRYKDAAVAAQARNVFERPEACNACRGIAPKRIVIGENMDRVGPYAEKIGAEVYEGLPGFKPGMEAEGLADNMRVIQQKMAEGYEIIDIGPDFARRAVRGGPQPAYQMERTITKGYEGYSKAFTRTSKTTLVLPEP